MWLQFLLLAFVVGLGFSVFLYHINSVLSTTPEEVAKIAGKPWTDEVIREAYEKCRKSRPDFKKYLPPKQDRRYIVFGGSGLVGGWMVEHLIMRGQNPAAIRIVDLQPPCRELAVTNNVPHFKADVTDRAAVEKVFNAPWPAEFANLPLTVFHTVAYIHAGYGKADFLDTFMKVNVEGTRNVLEAARAAGCDIFIATSSGSIGIRPANFLFPPWQKYPRNFVQISENADPPSLDKVENFAGCYAYSKALAEKLVTDADDMKAGFRTGAIRPGHAIYGHGAENRNSVVYDYLRRGGLPTWLYPLVLQYVSAQNVSLAHLLYEARLLEGRDVGGNAYCVSDPGPPFRYTDLFRLLSTLAHPKTPMHFTPVPGVLLVLVAHLLEGYIVLQRRHLNFLPAVTNYELTMLQPAVFNYSTLYIIYDDSRARKELGYNPGHTTLEGLCLHVLEWNEKVDAKLKTEGKVPDEANTLEKNVPVAPKGAAI
ncbi:hypothetical protein G647_05608 [Cladophialophora carrionii CBS 160.54]|uniref:3-beta hydroxysteroid dehydrogenase/isomerase domain-containing protein n=1 Tax=Cladophialophora carrionii CBS 160.54 TaxID=1279043 RepID=V9DCW3_9EURO|nr:uncharacterized protein G647_05608 [Cladophialophora carrionii CBS 160.54]ETI23802.1 hypothetical protein G647_05608 [Cladophialophora carrionii CBS 160.54]